MEIINISTWVRPTLEAVTSTNSQDTTGKKPSLMDKSNPKKDAVCDGKAGIMD